MQDSCNKPFSAAVRKLPSYGSLFVHDSFKRCKKLKWIGNSGRADGCVRSLYQLHLSDGTGREHKKCMGEEQQLVTLSARSDIARRS